MSGWFRSGGEEPSDLVGDRRLTHDRPEVPDAVDLAKLRRRDVLRDVARRPSDPAPQGRLRPVQDQDQHHDPRQFRGIGWSRTCRLGRLLELLHDEGQVLRSGVEIVRARYGYQLILVAEHLEDPSQTLRGPAVLQCCSNRAGHLPDTCEILLAHHVGNGRLVDARCGDRCRLRRHPQSEDSAARLAEHADGFVDALNERNDILPEARRRVIGVVTAHPSTPRARAEAREPLDEVWQQRAPAQITILQATMEQHDGRSLPMHAPRDLGPVSRSPPMNALGDHAHPSMQDGHSRRWAMILNRVRTSVNPQTASQPVNLIESAAECRSDRPGEGTAPGQSWARDRAHDGGKAICRREGAQRLARAPRDAGGPVTALDLLEHHLVGAEKPDAVG